MTRLPPLLWFALIAIFLLPTAAGRFIIDLAGGLVLTLLAIPLLLTGAGWIGWRILQSRLIKCEFCGASLIQNSNSIICPACGSNLSSTKASKSEIENSVPASSATIDVTAKEAD